MRKIIFVMMIVIFITASEAFALKESRDNRNSTVSAANSPNPCGMVIYVKGQRVRKPCPEVTYINGRRVRTAHYYMCRGSLPRSAANRRCVCSNRRRRG